MFTLRTTLLSVLLGFGVVHFILPSKSKTPSFVLLERTVEPCAIPPCVVTPTAPTVSARLAITQPMADPEPSVVQGSARWLRVVDRQGFPVAAAEARLSRGDESVGALTDASGKLALQTTDHHVQVSALGLATCELRGDSIAALGETELVLPPAGSLEVTLLDSTGRLLPGVTVEAVLEEPPHPARASLLPRFSARSDSSGMIRFSALGEGDYWLVVHPSQHAMGVDLYGQRALAGRARSVVAVTSPRNPMTYLDVRVPDLPGAGWHAGECLNYAVQVQGQHGLVSIQANTWEATVHGEPGGAVRCRIVALKNQYIDTSRDHSAWIDGRLGQEAPLDLHL
jgi:hypothetical protein